MQYCFLSEHTGHVATTVIPAFNHSGVLPPYDPARGAAHSPGMSPYKVSATELVAAFATSDERKRLLRGLLSYREALRAAGISNGFQWIDGSFTEQIEMLEGRPPRDIDVVTFAHRPVAIENLGDLAAQAGPWKALVDANPQVFQQPQTSATYSCDAYFNDLTGFPPEYLVSRTRYWFGLFSHRRHTNLWKGLLELPLQSDDPAALALV